MPGPLAARGGSHKRRSSVGKRGKPMHVHYAQFNEAKHAMRDVTTLYYYFLPWDSRMKYMQQQGTHYIQQPTAGSHHRMEQQLIGKGRNEYRNPCVVLAENTIQFFFFQSSPRALRYAQADWQNCGEKVTSGFI